MISLDSYWGPPSIPFGLCTSTASTWFCDIAIHPYNELPLHQSKIMHKMTMSNSECLTDDALTTFEPGISYLTSPIDWLQSDVNRVNDIIQSIATLTGKTEIQEANFRGAMIYQVCFFIWEFDVHSLTCLIASDHIYIRASYALCWWTKVFSNSIPPVHHSWPPKVSWIISRKPCRSGEPRVVSLSSKITRGLEIISLIFISVFCKHSVFLYNHL